MRFDVLAKNVDEYVRAAGSDLSQREVLTHRLARLDDVDDLEALMDAAIGELQKPFLDPAQIASSRAIMGLDTQLIEDGTYFVVMIGAELAGCGGWSRRATLYGSDRTDGRLLPAAAHCSISRRRSPRPFARSARIRGTHAKAWGDSSSDCAKRPRGPRGSGVWSSCPRCRAKRSYRACGYGELEQLTDDRGGFPVPLIRMAKQLG